MLDTVALLVLFSSKTTILSVHTPELLSGESSMIVEALGGKVVHCKRIENMGQTCSTTREHS